MPAMSADSGWPWPDIRWHDPHAFGIGPFTLLGAGGCSSGNQSGGFALPAIAVASYSRLLPAARTVAGTFGSGGCTLSGMLYAHSGRPFGIVVGVGFCARTAARATTDITSSVATGTRNAWRMLRIMRLREAQLQPG